MSDYGRPIQFGYFLTPVAADSAQLIATAQLLDELEFDLVGVQDHPYQKAFLDAWTLLSVIAARTERLTVFPDVASLPLRDPAMLAKAAASLDLLSGGRVELGLGAGAFWDAIEAMGGQRRTPGESITALREAIDVAKLMWSGERSVSYSGNVFSLKGVHPGPVPAHPIGIWVGAYKPRMLRLTGEVGDGWLPSLGYLTPVGIREASATIDSAATEAGRNPADIRRILNVAVSIPTAELPDLLTGLAVDEGIDTFVLSGPPTKAALTELAREVIPRVREGVERRR